MCAGTKRARFEGGVGHMRVFGAQSIDSLATVEAEAYRIGRPARSPDDDGRAAKDVRVDNDMRVPRWL